MVELIVGISSTCIPAVVGNSRMSIYFFLTQYFIQKKQFVSMNNLCEELSKKHVWQGNANKTFSTSNLDQLFDEFLTSSPFDDVMLLNVQPYCSPTHEHQRANLNITSEIEEIQFQDSSIVLESLRKRLQYNSETSVRQETYVIHEEMDQIERVGQKHHSPTSREKNRARIVKNFLTCLKRNILLLKMTQFQKINDEVVRSFLRNEKRTNRFEFEKAFKNEEVRAILCVLFNSKLLYRQLQLSVISSKNRQIYLKELSLMKKALIEGRLPNL